MSIEPFGRCGGLTMDSHSLAEDLDALTEALGDPALDLRSVLKVLSDDLTAAVPTFLGLILTLDYDERDVTIMSFAARTAAFAKASLWWPLMVTGGALPRGNVVFYASAEDAFFDLAEDAGWMFIPDGQAVVDGHLPPPAGADQACVIGMSEFNEINQAIGVIVALGHTPSEANLELHRLANGTRRTILETARDLTRNATVKPPAT